MSSGGVFSNQAIGGLAVRNMNIAVLAQILQQQQIAGAAMVEMIQGSNPQGSAPARSAGSSVPSPPQGAPEPGKGTLVDVTG
ncbi:MAG: hypothetical protein KDC98_25930 [Planctomycetes bacterium]|nr:hypothetical protein [Planctomycetota bacterium]